MITEEFATANDYYFSGSGSSLGEENARLSTSVTRKSIQKTEEVVTEWNTGGFLTEVYANLKKSFDDEKETTVFNYDDNDDDYYYDNDIEDGSSDDKFKGVLVIS